MFDIDDRNALVFEELLAIVECDANPFTGQITLNVSQGTISKELEVRERRRVRERPTRLRETG